MSVPNLPRCMACGCRVDAAGDAPLVCERCERWARKVDSKGAHEYVAAYTPRIYRVCADSYEEAWQKLRRLSLGLPTGGTARDKARSVSPMRLYRAHFGSKSEEVIAPSEKVALDKLHMVGLGVPDRIEVVS